MENDNPEAIYSGVAGDLQKRVQELEEENKKLTIALMKNTMPTLEHNSYGNELSQFVKHNKLCQCVLCQMVRAQQGPDLVSMWYETDGGSRNEVESVWMNNANKWYVNYVISHPVYNTGSVGTWTLEQWNIACKSWRRDLCPEGIKGKGWRASE